MHPDETQGDPRQIIEQLRVAKGFPSLRALAIAAGISQPTLSRYMAGDTDTMVLSSFAALAHTLDVTVSELTGEVPLNVGDRRLKELLAVAQSLPEPERAALLAAGKAMADATRRRQ